MKQQFNYVLINKRNICFILENLILFCFWVTFSWTSVQISAVIDKVVSMLFSQRRSNVEATPNICWFNFHFQPNINVETTLGHQPWIYVILSMLFQRCFVNVETTSINIRRLNFQFQPNFRVEVTLVHQRWINAIS